MTTQRNKFLEGRRGEDVAADFLVSSGLEILCRNFRCPVGEIDIIAKEGDRVVFVEVRTRRPGMFGEPEATITAAKRWRIIRAAQWFINKNRLENSPARIDVVAIRWNDGRPDINWIVNAFEARGRW